MAPRVRREPKPSTVQFIAMLRALGLAVASHGVSHAQIERRLCDWINEGRMADEGLRNRPADNDRERLRRLSARKVAVEESGLARADARRDKAGGQRIGDLLAGRFPRDVMPSRRRIEVCIDVFLQFLEEKDPPGYAEGLYGTREIWLDLWLQADQGHLPKLGRKARTVLGYLDVALEQLHTTLNSRLPVAQSPTAAAGDLTAGASRAGAQPADMAVTPADADSLIEQVRAEAALQLRRQREEFTEKLARALADARTEADQGLAQATAAHAAAAQRAEAAEAKLTAAAEARNAAERTLAELDAGEATDHATVVRLRRLCAALAVLLIITLGALVLTTLPILRDRSEHLVQLAAPAQQGTSARQTRFSFVPALPSGRSWTLHLRLTVIPTDTAAACTYGALVTAHVEVDGQALPSFTSAPGQTSITRTLPLGHRGSRSLQFVVTRIATDPECVLGLDITGSYASATG